jgi:Tfp pilus assembly protein PilF
VAALRLGFGSGSGVAHVPAPMLAVLAAGAVFFTCASAGAQAGNQGAMAEALFLRARALMANGNYDEACPKFVESYKIDPKLGTLMNLALCHEKAGMTASAWAEYTQAAELARRSAQSERESIARQHAAAMEHALAHVIIEADAKEPVAVMLDGQAVGEAAFGTPMPVDPGDHVLQATSPGRAAFQTTFHVQSGDPDRALHVPDLAPLTAAPAPLPDPPVPSPPTPAQAVHGHPAPATRTLGIVAGGVGVAAIGVGAFFGLRAFANKDMAEKACGASFCLPAGDDAKSAMKTDEVVSTIGFVAGAAALGAGLYLVLTSRRPEPHVARLEITVAPRALTIGGAW